MLGETLFFHYRAQAYGQAADREALEARIDGLIDAIGEASHMGVFIGVLGGAWVLRHLRGRAEPCLGGLATDFFEPVDAILEELLLLPPSRSEEFDLISGHAGFAVYAAEGAHESTGRRQLAAIAGRLSDLAVRDEDGARWRSPPRESRPDVPFDLGVAHGTAGVLWALAAASRAHLDDPRPRTLFDDTVRWLLAQGVPGPGRTMPHEAGQKQAGRAAWCYGDPGVGGVLAASGQCLNEASLVGDGAALALRAIPGSVEEAHVFDPPFCHGAAGLAHIYQRLHRTTGDVAFANAARRWIRFTLAFRSPDRGVAGLGLRTKDGWSARTDVLEGATGIGLMLLAATEPIDPEWDRLLLLSPPAFISSDLS